MTDATLQAFRDIAESMQSEPTDWQWIGPHMSQRMFGITRTRAEGYAKSHGGTAQQMLPRFGQAVMVRGQEMTIVAIHPAGTVDVRAASGQHYRVSGLAFGGVR